MQANTMCAFKTTPCTEEVLAGAHLEATLREPASCELAAHQHVKQLQSVKQHQKQLQNLGSRSSSAGLATTLQ